MSNRIRAAHVRSRKGKSPTGNHCGQRRLKITLDEWSFSDSGMSIARSTVYQEDQRLGRLFDRRRRTFAAVDKQRILTSVQQLKDRHHESQNELVRRVIRHSGRLSAVAGVVASAPALSPGFGIAVSMVAMAPEDIMMSRLKTAMVLRIATICGFDRADRQRLPEVLARAGAPCRVLEALGVAKDDLGRLADRIATGLGRRAGEAAGGGTKVASRGYCDGSLHLDFSRGQQSTIGHFVYWAARHRLSTSNCPKEH